MCTHTRHFRSPVFVFREMRKIICNSWPALRLVLMKLICRTAIAFRAVGLFGACALIVRRPAGGRSTYLENSYSQRQRDKYWKLRDAIDIRYYLGIQLIFMRVCASFVTSENISMKATEAETPWIDSLILLPYNRFMTRRRSLPKRSRTFLSRLRHQNKPRPNSRGSARTAGVFFMRNQRADCRWKSRLANFLTKVCDKYE